MVYKDLGISIGGLDFEKRLPPRLCEVTCHAVFILIGGLYYRSKKKHFGRKKSF